MFNGKLRRLSTEEMSTYFAVQVVHVKTSPRKQHLGAISSCSGLGTICLRTSLSNVLLLPNFIIPTERKKEQLCYTHNAVAF